SAFGLRLAAGRQSLLVDRLRVEDALGDDGKLTAVELAEEAALVALVARRATDLLDLQEHRVGVAIDVDLAHLLDVAALLPLAPELAAPAAVVDGPAGAERLLERLAVHPSEHEHLASVRVLGDHRDQPAGLVEV